MRSLLLILIPALYLSAAPVEKPDTNFKSIHQVQSEQNRPDPVRPGNPAPVDTVAVAPPANKILGTATLFVVVFILLLITVCVAIVFIFRRKKKSR